MLAQRNLNNTYLSRGPALDAAKKRVRNHVRAAKRLSLKTKAANSGGHRSVLASLS